MTPEELLRPRYKVIADYPGNDYGVDEIIPLSEYKGLYALIQGVNRKAIFTVEKIKSHVYYFKWEWHELKVDV